MESTDLKKRKNMMSSQKGRQELNNVLFYSIGSVLIQQLWRSRNSIFLNFCKIIAQYCPAVLRRFAGKLLDRLSDILNPYVQISIHEFLGNYLNTHEAYHIVQAYVSSISADSAKNMKAEMSRGTQKFVLTNDDREATDEFGGVTIQWLSGKFAATSRSSNRVSLLPEPDTRFYKLIFDRRQRKIVTESYLEHVMTTGRKIRDSNKKRRLYTNCNNGKTIWGHIWSHTMFDHPATFDTLAMEPEKKQEIIDDLMTFTRSKEFYSKIGKTWKRGYLLYGPPGTGKSTMIAAMANLLNYDVYDLELTSVRDNSELKRLLTEITSKSITVIEDIDCSLDLTGQRNENEKEKEKKITKKEGAEKESVVGGGGVCRVTLSGLLNFIDGLWSSCGGERIIVFTTNFVQKLDKALTRRGRMDKHIEMSYCRFGGFKVLARNYLDLEEHPLFERIEILLGGADITPADVAENLMPKSQSQDYAEKCLLNLIQALEEAKEKKDKKTSGDSSETGELEKEDQAEEQQET